MMTKIGLTPSEIGRLVDGGKMSVPGSDGVLQSAAPVPGADGFLRLGAPAQCAHGLTGGEVARMVAAGLMSKPIRLSDEIAMANLARRLAYSRRPDIRKRNRAAAFEYRAKLRLRRKVGKQRTDDG